MDHYTDQIVLTLLQPERIASVSWLSRDLPGLIVAGIRVPRLIGDPRVTPWRAMHHRAPIEIEEGEDA